MNNPLVTVVVPIYNVEKYLDRCVSSIIGQTYRNLEIILVDDGSPDNCPRMCDDYAAKDPRIKVIHKENAGLGMARNTGIDHAVGEYICFFDSDDYVEPDTVEACVSAAQEHMADLVIFGHDDVTTDEALLAARVPCPPQPIFCGEDITSTLLPMSMTHYVKTDEEWNLTLSAWSKFYSMDVIRKSGWRFASERDIISEDFYSLTELYGYLGRVYVLDRVFYHYTVNNTSLSRSYNQDRFEKIKVFYDALVSLSQKMGLSNVLDQPVKWMTFGLTIGAMKMIVASDLGFKARYRALRSIVKDGRLQEIVKTARFSGSNFKKRILHCAIKYKFVWIVFFCVYLKNKQKA